MQPVFIVKKGRTSQQYDEKTRRIPVTILKTPPVYLADIKTKDRHGYDALMLTLGTAKHIDRPTLGTLKKKGIEVTPELVQEVRMRKDFADRLSYKEVDGARVLSNGESDIAIGSQIHATHMFHVGDMVDVTGVSKGKGFQGVVKRHGFHGGPKTHGQSDRWRAPGSIGSGTTPGRINKGKRMAGRMGGDTITIQGLTIVSISEESITVKGLVPGTVGTTLVVRLAQHTS